VDDGGGLLDEDDGVLGGKGTDGRVYVGLGDGLLVFFVEVGVGDGLPDVGGGLPVPRGVPGSTGGSGGLCFGGPCVGSGDVGRIGTVIPTPSAYTRSRLITSRT
jgi:hypothetical protein